MEILIKTEHADQPKHYTSPTYVRPSRALYLNTSKALI